MKRKLEPSLCLALFSVAALFAATPAIAEKPAWAGGGKHGKQHEEQRDEQRQDSQRGTAGMRFDDHNRRIINDYYGAEFRAGKCPPGLAKKHNGCQPPGQAKKWNRGSPLPADLNRYDLPYNLLSRLPAPPSGHRYVRVDSDVLLINSGTNMVLDAIENIGR